MIVVTAANGQQGRLLVPKLVAAGVPVRALVRSEESAVAMRAAGAANVIVGGFDDPAVIARAVEGAEKVYYICPTIDPAERAAGFAWIDAAKAAGARHFVFSSVLHAILTDLVQHEIKRDIEEYLISADMPFTILQPSIYMAPRRFDRAIESGVLRAGWSLDRRQSLVDLGDVTDVAVMALTDSERHDAATYELVGSGPHTAHDMGAIIAKVIGREVAVERIGPDAYLAGLFGGRQLDPEQHEARVGRSLSARYTSHDFLGNSNVLAWLLGRKPTTFEGFVTARYEAMR